MSFLSSLFGSKPKMKQKPALSPEQTSFLNQLLGTLGQQGIGGGSQALSYLQQMLQGGPEATEAFTAPYMSQFYGEIVPHLAEQFTGAGAGSQRSSAFGQQLGGAGAGLMERLASMRSGLQQQSATTLLNSLMGIGGLGLGAKPFGYMQTQGSPGLFGNLAGAAGSGLGLSMGLGESPYTNPRNLGKFFGILS